MRILLLAVLSAGPVLFPAYVTAASQPLQPVLQSEIIAGMKESQVPGVAVAMIKDGSVLFSGGFGVRTVGSSERVDENTLFAIGSVTKSFTAASMALLVDQKKLQWDDRVQRFEPEFELADTTRAAEVTIRDLLSHRTGIQSDNMVFWGTGVSSKDLIRRFPALKLPWGLREHFDYNNLMYMVAGDIVAQVSGESWPEFVRKNIFLPLGMRSSSARTSDLKDRANMASAHMLTRGSVRAIPLLDLDNIAPAGAIVSNATDMMQWVRVQLGENVAGSKLLSDASLAEMHTAQIPMDRSPPYSWLIQGSALSAYGFGWMLSDYDGHLLLQHGGDTDGMASLVALVPDQHFGLVILSNLGDPWFRQIVLYRVLDALLQRPAFDWAALYRDINTQLVQQEASAQNHASTPGKSPHPASLPICGYTGGYHHPLYGDAVVSCDGGVLRIGMLGNRARLTHLHYDTFAVQFEQFNALQQQAISSVTFGLDATGRATMITIADGIQFTRIEPPKPARS
jgi:CubicO group peptidase (beta-lactamase class C family)